MKRLVFPSSLFALRSSLIRIFWILVFNALPSPPMILLGIDVGSSSVKSGVVRDGRILGELARTKFETHYAGVRAEVDAEAVLAAVAKAVKQLGPRAKKVDAIGLSVMSPSWVAMDKQGRALTP